MIAWIKRYSAAKHMRIKLAQLRRARVELAHFEQMQEQVNCAVAWRKATIKRLEKECK